MLSTFTTNSINILAGLNGLEVSQTLVIALSICINDALYLPWPKQFIIRIPVPYILSGMRYSIIYLLINDEYRSNWSTLDMDCWRCIHCRISQWQQRVGRATFDKSVFHASPYRRLSGIYISQLVCPFHEMMASWFLKKEFFLSGIRLELSLETPYAISAEWLLQ